MVKLGLITSRGGHLYQLYQLKKFWSRYNRFWVSFPGRDTCYYLKNEKVYLGYYPESRHILNAIRNLFLAIKILTKERPDFLISCGAGIAPPFFLIAKIMGIKTIFIEPYDFIEFPSLSGKLLTPLVNKYLVQHPKQLKFSKKAEYWGETL
jgi:UDP-N-acetylglucosamine:LPS N-acetylglucosamine transferase